MKLKNLLQDLTADTLPDDLDIKGLCFDSRLIKEGDVFFALPGLKADGANYLAEASKGGALALVVAKGVQTPPDSLVIAVENTRLALAVAASRFYQQPSKKFFLTGVTGTNGKTTLTYLIKSLLEHQNKTCGLMGTIEILIGSKSFAATHTTPDAVSIQKTFQDMLSHNVDDVVMEASSHALDQRRVDGSDFDVAIFTNLTQDHLDYHNSFEDYFNAKARLFEDLLVSSCKKNKAAIINLDDPFGQQLIQRLAKSKLKILSFSMSNAKADLYVKDFHSSLKGFEATFVFKGKETQIQSNLIGEHNLKNIMAAYLFGEVRFGNGDFASVFKNISIPGRLERVGSQAVFVDYAHTPDALENVLQAIRRILVKESSPGRLITVFGCGGDRDKTKRPLMGEAAARLSDIAIVTSDNPRTENPDSILKDIVPGVAKHMSAYDNGKGYLVEVDRQKAIKLALEHKSPEDVVIVAGKGHEDYQIIGTKKIHFDDREVLRDLMT